MGRVGRIVAGSALIAASFFVPPAGLFGVSLLSGALVLGAGASLAIGGVSSFLQPRPRLASSSALGQSGGRVINIQQQAAPTRVIYGRQLVQFGTIVYTDLAGTNNEYVRICGVLCNHEIAELEAVYFDGVRVSDGDDFSGYSIGDNAFVEVNYGTDDQVALPQLVSDTGGLWSSTDRCRGHATIYIRLIYDAVKYPNGLPKIEFLVRGKPVYDPVVLDTTYSANGARIVNDYLTNSRFGVGLDFAARVNEDALVAAANLSGEQLTVPDYAASPVSTTTENRYEVNAVFETTEPPGQILNLMMACLGGGGLPYISGQFHILPAAYRAPSLTLSEGDLIAPISYTSRRSRREMANTITGTFISPERGWKETSFPEVTDAAALALDGERLVQPISLPYVISQHAAQRLAWLALQKIRLQKPLSITTKLTGYAVQPGNGLALDVAALGWTGKGFEVQDLSLAQLSDANNQPVFGIQHALLENPAAIYDDIEDYQEVPQIEEPVHQSSDIPFLDSEDCGIVGGVISLVGTFEGDRTPFCATAVGLRTGLLVPFLVAEGGYFFGTAVYRVGTEAAMLNSNVGLGRGGNFTSVGIVLYQEFTIQNDGSTGPKVFIAPGERLALDPLRLETGESLRFFTRPGGNTGNTALYAYWSTNYKGDNGVILLGFRAGGQVGSTDNFHSIFGHVFELTEDKAKAALPAGTLKRTQLQLTIAQPASGNQVLTIRKNGVDTAHKYTIAASAVAESLYPPIISDVVFADGDLISVQDDNNATTDGAHGVLSMSYELATPGACLLGFRLRTGASTTHTFYPPWVFLGAEALTLNNCRFPLPRGFLLEGSNCRLVLVTALTGAQTITAKVLKNGADSGVEWNLTSSSPTNEAILATGSAEFNRGDDICIEYFGNGFVGFVSDITLMGLKRIAL